MTYQLHHGDCINIMPLIERESIDAVICDPPYGLGFMGKDWDHGVPGMHFWLEALRCAKPGAYLLAFGGTRTFHRLAVAIEDAGWEIRDTVMWVYGQGFPKSHDVSKAIDREAGAEREVIGPKTYAGGLYTAAQLDPGGNTMHKGYQRPWRDDPEAVKRMTSETKPATPAAAEWDGWGTALKPAWEPIIVARKPLQGTVAENVQRYGTGAMNIDACRIETDWDNESSVRNGHADKTCNSGGITGWGSNKMHADPHPQGRWPANIIHDGSAEVLAGFPNARSSGNYPTSFITQNNNSVYGVGVGNTQGQLYADTGSAARFFKECPLDNVCSLCYNTYTKADDTEMTEWKSILAHSAEKHGWTIQATNEFIARVIAIGSQSKSIARNARSAESLCDLCGMSIAAALVGIKTSAFSEAELQVILGYMTNSKSYILIQNLVSFAGLWENIDIIPTTTSLSLLFGSVHHAIANYTKQDTRGRVGLKSGQSRFVYSAKASKQDRDEGLEGIDEVLSMRYGEKGQGPLPQQTPSRPVPQRNHHPTVKPTALMRYLCRLVTPPQGVILDPFMGSGSTGKAAMLEGFNFIGIDTEIEYVEIAARRIEHACEKVGIVIDQPMMFETRRETADRPKQLILL